MFGLLGPNGAGKSTLMRTIATLQDPDEGSIQLADIDVIRQKDRVRETLGYLPQEFGLFPNVTAERLLDHFAVLKGITGRGRAGRSSTPSSTRRTCTTSGRRSSAPTPGACASGSASRSRSSETRR